MLQFLSFIPNVLGMVGDYFEGKRKLKRAEVESKLRVHEAVTEGNVKLAVMGKTSEIAWENTMAKASESSWKDEWFTVVLSIPAIMAFVPLMAPYVAEGFAALSTTPDWYQSLLIMAVAASFGIRAWKGLKNNGG